MKIMRKRTKLRPSAIDEHLPLRPVAFAVLAALADRPRPGIEILDEVNATVPGSFLLGPGTLYRLMKELRQQGLIGRVAAPTDAPQDERRAHHELTALGTAVLRADAARLRRTLKLVEGRRHGAD